MQGRRIFRPKSERKKVKKIVDLACLLCYIMYYLSDERSIFVRFFGRKNAPVVQYREAMPGLKPGK